MLHYAGQGHIQKEPLQRSIAFARHYLLLRQWMLGCSTGRGSGGSSTVIGKCYRIMLAID